MKVEEFKRQLKQQGVRVTEGAKHSKLYYGDRQSTLPRHKGDMATGTQKAILKQLGL